MSAYQNLLVEVEKSLKWNGKVVTVQLIDLVEVMDELETLRCAGAPGTKKSKYTPEFELAWADYPTRPGNSKAAAFKAWAARIKAGATAAQMHEGTQRYAAYCKANGTEPQYIKQAATFYGPGEHYAADWTVAVAAWPVRTTRQQQQAQASEEALRRLDGIPVFDPNTIDMEQSHGSR